MTEFLSYVLHSPRLVRAARCGGSSILCMRHTRIGEMWFSVRDDGWYGWFEVEHERRVEGDAIDHVYDLIRALPRRGQMFRFEINEYLGVVRAIFQLPIHIENRFPDDINAAIQRLVEEWEIFVPFVNRVLDGDGVEQVSTEAKQAFAAFDAGRKVAIPACIQANS